MNRKRQMANRMAGCACVMGIIAAAHTIASADSLSIEAFNNATVQPAGPRSGANGKAFFNIEGSANNNNASFGVSRFDVSTIKSGFDTTFGPNNWHLEKVEFQVTQSNAAFTHSGGMRISFTADDAASIEPGGGLNYNPAGNHLDNDFVDAQTLTDYAFTVVATGFTEDYTLYDITTSNPAASLAMLNHFCLGNLITLLQTETDSTVAATYGGFSNSTVPGPTLVFTAESGNPNCGSNHIPVVHSIVVSAPYSAVANTSCTYTLVSEDADGPNSLTFAIAGGTLGGSLSLVGAPIHAGATWTQTVSYSIPAGLRGKDSFTYTTTDGSATSSPTSIDIAVRGNAGYGAVAFGASSPDPLDTMRVYTGDTAPGGGTAGTLDRLLGPGFAQATEFDNYNGVRHNPFGNLLALDFGSLADGGSLLLYPTRAECDTTGGISVFTFNTTSTDLPANSRVTGLSVSPDNSKLAIVGTDAMSLIVLNYAEGPDVGTGGPGAATVTFNRTISLIDIMASNKSVGTTWLDNDHVLIIDTDGNIELIEVSTSTVIGGPFAPWIAAPFLMPNISTADVEYNPEISPYIFVAVGQFSAGASTNTIYVADPTTQTLVEQSGGQTSTDYSDGTQETFREISLDSAGNLFIGTFVDLTVLTNIKYLPNAIDVGNIVGGNASLVIWRTVNNAGGESASNFSGLDVAASCSLVGDLNTPIHDGLVNGADINEFVNCYLAGPAVTGGCVCADIDKNGVINHADVDAFVHILVP